jgi:hypothetical protein
MRSPFSPEEHPEAQQYSNQYHNTIREFINEIRAENGGLGLLFDLHGTAGIDGDPADLYLGTADGQTVARLLQVDQEALWRPRSLRGFLTSAGRIVSPKQPNIPEAPALSGGYTVRTYGSSNADGLDAIQIEIASSLRNNVAEREALIEELAYAIGSLAARYADTHTFAVFRSINLFGGGVVQMVTGQLQRHPMSHDLRLQLGGGSNNRGRVELRHDSGATGEFAAPRRAGVLVLCDENGRDYYLWVDIQGKLRISPSDSGANSQAGTIVGVQT